MTDLRRIEQRVSKVQHGFKEMKEEAAGIVGEASVEESLRTARRLYESQKHQVRMVAVFVLGFVAIDSREAIGLLRSKASRDVSWQVQEILAQAFNGYCKALGYEKALPAIEDWLADENPNVRRAVTEGLRIWNQKDYFKEHPDVAIRLLAGLRDDESEYVRRSVGNALRDVSRKEGALVQRELACWDVSDPKVRFTHRLAGKKSVLLSND